MAFCSGGPVHSFHKVQGSDVVAVDMNSDGAQDLVVFRSPEMDVLLNNKRGHLGRPVGYRLEQGMHAKLHLADINGDQRQDVLASSGQVFMAEEHGYATAGIKLPETIKWLPSDLNGDGATDLLTVKLYKDQRGKSKQHIAVILNLKDAVDGGKKLRVKKLAQLESVPGDYQLGDFDRDGDPDLAVLLPKGEKNLKVYENKLSDDEGFVLAQEYQVGTASAIFSGDFNDDSLPDLILSLSDKSEGKVLAGTGHLKFEDKPVLKLPGPLRSLAFGNLDGDRHTDLALVCYGVGAGNFSKDVILYSGNGVGGFEEMERWDVHPRPAKVLVVDLEGSPLQDVVVLSEESEMESFLQKD